MARVFFNMEQCYFPELEWYAIHNILFIQMFYSYINTWAMHTYKSCNKGNKNRICWNYEQQLISQAGRTKYTLKSKFMSSSSFQWYLGTKYHTQACKWHWYICVLLEHFNWIKLHLVKHRVWSISIGETVPWNSSGIIKDPLYIFIEQQIKMITWFVFRRTC